MASTPLMVITTLGLQVASQATPSGPYIHITDFKIGTAYGYMPQPSDPGLNGNVLYEGQPIAYAFVEDAINIICKIPADAGPFDFGEVALYLSDGTMFAKAAFDTPQSKFSSLGTNLQSTYTFNCLLKLQQSPAVFQIGDGESTPDVLIYERWSDVYPPALSANPELPMVIVTEQSFGQNSSLLTRVTDNRWTLATNYDYYSGTTVSNGTLTSVDVPKVGMPTTTATTDNRKFVVEFSNGLYRSVSGVSDEGTFYRFNLNPDVLPSLPVVGSELRVYRDTLFSAETDILWSDILDAPIATRTIQGVTQYGNGIRSDAPGSFYATGLLHGAPGTGSRLVAANNLNDPMLGSGLYTAYGNNYPLNYPPGINWPGTIQVINTLQDFPGAGHITQQWFPAGTGGGDATGKDGLPSYYRAFISGTTAANAVWSSWFPYGITDKRTPGGGGVDYTSLGTFQGSWSEVNPTGTYAFYTMYGGNNNYGSPTDGRQNAYAINAYVNGIGVIFVNDSINGNYRIGGLSFVAPPGATVSMSSQPYPLGSGRVTIMRLPLPI